VSAAIMKRKIAADMYASGCLVLAAVTFPDQVVL
jgi:hypothetical protein